MVYPTSMNEDLLGRHNWEKIIAAFQVTIVSNIYAFTWKCWNLSQTNLALSKHYLKSGKNILPWITAKTILEFRS